MKILYRALFTCKMCHVTFTSSEGAPDGESALAALNEKLLSTRRPPNDKFEPHRCQGGHFGLAEFIGFSKETTDGRP